MIRMIGLAVVATILAFPSQVLAQGPDRPEPPGPPVFIEKGPRFKVAATLYTSALEGLWYRCSVLNTTGLPLDVSIKLFTADNQEYAAVQETIPPRETRSVAVDPEFVIGFPIYQLMHCRIRFQGDKDAVRGVLQTHVGEIFLPPPPIGSGDRQHRQGSTSSEAR